MSCGDLRNLPTADVPMCSSGKRPFRTEDDAAEHLRDARMLRAQGTGTQRRPDVVEASFYRCKCCGWYHLASTTGRGRRSSYANKKSRRR